MNNPRIRRFASLFALLLLGLALPFQVVAETTNARVISTGDGDTLRVRENGQTITVRLACIDAPESNQPGGQQSAARLRQLLPPNQAVQLVKVDQDRYGRTVAVVFRNRQSVNLQMVQEGQSVVYRDYLSGCPTSRNQLLSAEQQARSARRGFWSQANPVMPWDWRHGGSQSTAPSSPPAQTSSSLPTCVNSDCDCSDFQTQAEAQRVFNSFSGDPFRLDRDGDGKVCEGLP
ncbi:MAG TPA: thermonuclease family protein [Trichocoleus sp.]|jgi:micrococcal nuclease